MDPSRQNSNVGDAFNSFYESFMGQYPQPHQPSIPQTHPPAQPASSSQHPALHYPAHPGVHASHHPSSSAHGIYSSRSSATGYSSSGGCSTRMTPASPVPSSLGMGITPRSSGSLSAPRSSHHREGTFTPLTTIGSGSSGSESGYGLQPNKKARLDESGRATAEMGPPRLYMSDPAQHFRPSPNWGPVDPYGFPSGSEYDHAYSYSYDPTFGSGSSMVDPIYIYDEQEYEERMRLLQLDHERQQGHRRRGKFIAQRRPRAGEAIRPFQEEVPSTKTKGKQKASAAASRRARKSAKVEPPVVLIERDLEKVASADAPPQAQMEVHTLFIRPPASIFEERERERVRAARMKRRKGSAVGKEEDDDDDGLMVKSEEAVHLGKTAGSARSAPRRTQIYGPATAEWTFEYQDVGAPSTPSSTRQADVGDVKEEDGSAVPIKRKRGRPCFRSAVEICKELGVPLHPWAAPLHSITTPKEEPKTEPGGATSSSALLPASLRPTTRTEIDIFGRPSEFPLPTPQQPYSKLLRAQYRAFAEPSRAQLDLEKLWRHRVSVWEAERRMQGRRKVEDKVSPLYLRRNVALSKRRVIRWDYQDAKDETRGR
ncbi:hypothetical protein CF319_g6960 [Tilletia indica]|nr:hypothetical protein CF319_g6960 [Tilletia indica]